MDIKEKQINEYYAALILIEILNDKGLISDAILSKIKTLLKNSEYKESS